MRIFAIDLETSGQCTKTNFVIQIGACCIDDDKYWEGNPEACVVSRFSTYLPCPVGREWEPRCVEEFWSKHPETLARANNGVFEAKDDGVSRFLAWVKEHQDPDAAKNLLVSDNAAFDMVFLASVLPPGRSLLYLFGAYKNSPIDTHSFSLGVANRDVGMNGCNDADAGALQNLKTVFPAFKTNHDHDAGNDAVVVGLKFVHIYKKCSEWSW